MSAIGRGTKRRCASCEAPFYDMGRTPIVCPKCGAHFEPGSKRLVSVPRPAKGRSAKASSPLEVPASPADFAADDAPVPGSGDDDEAGPTVNDDEESEADADPEDDEAPEDGDGDTISGDR